MTYSSYARPYTEVLTLLSLLNEEEYNKIPREEIDFFKENCDKGYKFEINPKEELTGKNISKEANAILVILFDKYFASDIQKQKLRNILMQKQNIIEKKKQMQYNANKIFENRERIEKKEDNQASIIKEENSKPVDKKENNQVSIIKEENSKPVDKNENNQTNIIKEENNKLVEYKENIITKIINKIKNIWKKIIKK